MADQNNMRKRKKFRVLKDGEESRIKQATPERGLGRPTLDKEGSVLDSADDEADTNRNIAATYPESPVVRSEGGGEIDGDELEVIICINGQPETRTIITV